MKKLWNLFILCMLPCLVMLSSCRDEDIVALGMENDFSQTRADEQTTGGLVQQSDGTWVANRRVALVGPGRLINRINNSLLGLVNLDQNLDKIVNPDLTDHGTVGSSLSGVSLVGSILSVKDMYRTYKAGQKAGFVYKMNPDNANLLTVDVLKGFWVKFYKDGEVVGDTEADEEEDFAIADIGLVNIPGGEGDEERAIYATCAVDFDEVEIGTIGINVNVLSSLQLCYAFVGENPEIVAYNGNPYFTNGVEVNEDHSNINLISSHKNLVDKDTTNYEDWASILFDYSKKATVNFKQEIPVGSEVGFKYFNVNVLGLNILTGGYKVRTFGSSISNEDSYLESSDNGRSLLGISALGGGYATVSLKVTKEGTRQAMFYIPGGIKVSGGRLYYAYIRESIKMDPTNYFTLGDATISANSYQLYTPKEGRVVYTVTGPAGNPVKVSTSNRIEGMTQNGKYTVTAVYTADNGEKTVHTATITRKVSVVTGCNILLTAKEHGAEVRKSLVEGSGCLLCLEGFQSGEKKENLTDGSLSTYVTYIGGVDLAANIPITCIHLDNTQELKKILDSGKNIRTGFIVQTEAGLLNADVLSFFRVRLFKDGKEVDGGVTTGNDLVAASLVGESGNSMMRLSIVTKKEFNQIELWSSGVLNLELSRMRLYSAFYESENSACESVGIGEACTEMMTPINSNISINYAETQISPDLLGVIGGAVGLEHLIDGDMTTSALNGNLVDVLKNTTFAVKFDPVKGGQQMGFVFEGTGDILTLDVVKKNWSLSAYYKGERIEDETSEIPTLLNLDLLAHGGRYFLEITPPKDCFVDELRINFQSLVNALSTVKLCGFYIRRDSDGDGIPDCSEDPEQSADSEFTYTEKVENTCEDGTGNGLVKIYINSEKKQPGDKITVSYTAYSEGFKITHTQEVKIQGTASDMYFEIRLPVDEYVFQEGNFSATVRVYPLQTEWTGKVDDQWNSWGNWTNGAPWTCTNVIIPSSAPRYPELKDGVTNCCAGIHFEPGGEVVNTHYLVYDAAWVDMELEGERYYMLSAPLKDMCTGDIFISKDSPWRKANYFSEMNEESYIEYRVTPRIYQRLWSSVARGVTLKDGDKNVTPGETFWTAPFNAVNTRFEMGQGFSVMAKGRSTNRFYFPKMHKIYNYFYSTGNPTGKSDKTYRTGDGYRFIYEGTETGDGEWQVTLKNTEGYNNGKISTFLLGNPFMAHVDIQKFLEENESVLSQEVKVYDGNTLNSEIKADGQLLSYSEKTYTHIAPMQSVFVTAKDNEQGSITVTFTEDMLAQKPEDKVRSRAVSSGIQQKGIRITATDGDAESRCLLLKRSGATDAYRAGEDAEVLIDPATAPGVVVFTVADEKALDIQQFRAAERIPLGFVVKEESARATLKFSFTEKEWNGWVLKDTETGERYDLKTGNIVIGNLKSNIGRLYLEKIN
ncbi:hypothetical protein [Phocaeicola barnesiae]|uniref:DUF5689 domain-containing protein n=1 Tax=Phocaeicola barnesiae TaxID=376804 RepID=A0AAW5N9I8_9BACT|nr:hypothetical protein [Phocaeicola barnesiae]MCR8875090.1 hypothetical protein [Phocaeicola barnesiae]